MHIEILSPRYGGTDYLEPIGTITFQQTVGEDSWYGMRFEISTNDVKHLEQMTKLAKFIKKNAWDATPEKVLEIIGADEHVIFEGDFISTSKNGQGLYKVIANGGHYSNITASSEGMAWRKLKKLNIAGAVILFHKNIVL